MGTSLGVENIVTVIIVIITRLGFIMNLGDVRTFGADGSAPRCGYDGRGV
jgi:hypothetical protein